MNEISCTVCTIEVLEDRLVEVIYHKKTGAEITELKCDPKHIVPFIKANRPFPKESPYFNGSLGLRVDVKTLPVRYPRTFDGTPAQANEVGWLENEFGFVCPSCAATDYEAASNDAAVNDLDENPLVAVAAIAMVRQAKAESEARIVAVLGPEESSVTEIVSVLEKVVSK